MLELARTRLRPMLLAGLVAVLELIRMVFALRLPEGRLAGVIYDDAFYYIVCAKNFATLGRWTFDGVEPASGFHLLWGYLIAGVYWLAPGIGLYSLYFIMQLIQTACLAGAAWLSVKLAIRVFGPDAELGVALNLSFDRLAHARRDDDGVIPRDLCIGPDARPPLSH